MSERTNTYIYTVEEDYLCAYKVGKSLCDRIAHLPNNGKINKKHVAGILDLSTGTINNMYSDSDDWK